VNEMPIDIEKARAVRLLIDQMAVPDLIEKSTRTSHGS
jgi:hypothetical protein